MEPKRSQFAEVSKFGRNCSTQSVALKKESTQLGKITQSRRNPSGQTTNRKVKRYQTSKSAQFVRYWPPQLVFAEGQIAKAFQCGQLWREVSPKTVATEVNRNHAAGVVGLDAVPFAHRRAAEPVCAVFPIWPVCCVVEGLQSFPVCPQRCRKHDRNGGSWLRHGCGGGSLLHRSGGGQGYGGTCCGGCWCGLGRGCGLFAPAEDERSFRPVSVRIRFSRCSWGAGAPFPLRIRFSRCLWSGCAPFPFRRIRL